MSTTSERRFERRDTAANHTSNNSYLESGEWGIETDAGKAKLGPGYWNPLPYAFYTPAEVDALLAAPQRIAVTVSAGNQSSSYTIDPTAGDVFDIRFTGNVTLSINNGTSAMDGRHRWVRALQDSTGSRTLTWGGSNVRFGSDITATTLSTARDTTDYIRLTWNHAWSKWDVTAFRKGYINPLLQSLISWWGMDETSGDALDSHGTNTLTETSGTIDAATGKLGGARDFEAGDTEYFQISDNASISTGDIDFTICAWVNMESLPTQGFVVAKSATVAAGDSEYFIQFLSATNNFYLTVSNGSSFNSAQATNFGTPSTGVWLFIVAWHDSVGNTLNIQINNGTANTTSYSSGVQDSSSALHIGGMPGSGYWDGLIDGVGFWKRVLTAAERTALYNGGAGLNYPF